MRGFLPWLSSVVLLGVRCDPSQICRVFWSRAAASRRRAGNGQLLAETRGLHAVTRFTAQTMASSLFFHSSCQSFIHPPPHFLFLLLQHVE